MPAGLEAGSYCPQCFETRVRPEIEAYEQKLERARNMNVFLKKQGKEVVHLRRAQFPVKVENCEDRDEAILRLAFLAAEEGYDTIIGVDLTTTKVRDNSYQKTLWSGVGTPAEGRKKKSQS